MSRPETMTIGKLAQSADMRRALNGMAGICLSGALPTSECPILDALEQQQVPE